MANRATWRRCDFQLHTCRDPNWTGKRPPGVGDVQDGKTLNQKEVEELRHNWADEFITACKKNKLEAIAVTDHHEMVMIPYIRAAILRAQSADENFSLWLFPGMELTAKGGVQCLILFDSDIEDKWLKQAIGALNINHAEIDASARQGLKVTQLSSDYQDLDIALNKHSGLKGRYIILPNFSKGGKHTVLKDGWCSQLKNSRFIGGYLDRGQSLKNLGKKNITRLSGDDENWSNRFLYPIPTSDSRDDSFKFIGSNGTWIKLSAPTAEAIRQAFLASESRITIEPPSLPSLFIEKVRVAGSSVLEPTEIKLSNQLNSIIGGRGSGKSTFVEYVCYGIGRSCLDMEREQFSGKDRLKSLVTETLSSKGGSVEIFIRQDGALFKITRSAKNNYVPVVTYPNEQTQSVNVRELRSLFSAVVYSQNELAELGRRTGGKNDITDLLRFLHPDKKSEYDNLVNSIETAKSAFAESMRGLTEFWKIQALIHKLEGNRNSIQQRVDALEKSLPELSDTDKAIVSKYDKIAAFDDERKSAVKEIQRTLDELSAIETLPLGSANLSSAAEVDADPLRQSYKTLVDDFQKDLSVLTKKTRKDAAIFDAENKNWLPKYHAAKSARNTVLEKLSEHKNSTDQIIKLKDEIRTLNESINDTKAKQKQYDKVEEQYFDQAASLKAVAIQKATLIAECSSIIEELSNKKIKAKILEYGDHSELADAIEVLSRKTNSPAATRQKELASLLTNSDVWDLLDELRAEALGILRWKIIGAIKTEDKPKTPKLDQLIAPTDNIKTKLYELIDIERITPLASTVFKPSSIFTYCDGDREIAFDKASEGQRAGALLFMLLQQEGGPLIIDQPEGDLDNKIISEIAETLHQAKEKRQLIFVSHNANLVVNGSSEFVGYVEVADENKRTLSVTGAIDHKEICSAITANMEGGEKAFRDRQMKYGF